MTGDRVVAALLALPLLLLPLVRSDAFPYRDVGPRVFLLRASALAALAALAWWRIRAGGAPGIGRAPSGSPTPAAESFRPSWIALAGAAFLLSAAASTIGGVDRSRSLWDSPERMMGLWTLACAGAWYAAAVLAVRGWERWRVLLALAASAGGVACVVGVVEALVPLLSGETGGRAAGPLGHPTLLGTTALSTAFLWAILLSRAQQGRERAAAWIGIGTGVAAVVASQSRAAFLGLAAGAVAYAIVRAVLAPRGGPERRRWIAAAAAPVALAAAVVLLGRGPAGDAVPLLRRFSEIDPTGPAFEARRGAIRVAFVAAKERPILGWGPCNFAYAHAAWRPPVRATRGTDEVAFDHPHNAPLHAMATQGFPGMALWLLLHGAALLWLWRGVERGRFSPTTAAAAVGFLAARFSADLAGFDDAPALLQRVLFLAFVASEAADPPAEAEAGTVAHAGVSPGLRIAAAAAAALVPLAAAWRWDARPAVSHVATARAMEAAGRGDPAAADLASAAFAGEPAGAGGLRLLYGWFVLRSLPALSQQGKEDAARTLAHSAFDELGRAGAAHPLAVHPPIYRAALLALDADLRADPARPAAVEAELAAVARTAPRNPDLKGALSDLRTLRGDLPGALVAAAAMVADDPANGGAWLRLATLQDATGNRAGARRTIGLAREAHAHFTEPEMERVRRLEE